MRMREYESLIIIGYSFENKASYSSFYLLCRAMKSSFDVFYDPTVIKVKIERCNTKQTTRHRKMLWRASVATFRDLVELNRG